MVVDSGTLFDFINQKITYLHILKKAPLIYVIDKSYDGKTQTIYHLEFDQIPFQYLPLEKSLCPKQKSGSTFKHPVDVPLSTIESLEVIQEF